MDIKQEVLDIDLHNLTESLTNHAVWFDHYTQRLPELKRAQMEAKEEHARVGHELYLEYKRNPPEGMKVTDATLAALVATNQRYIDAHKHMMEIKEDHDSVERFRDLFERREKAMTMLVQLYRGQYWGGHVPEVDPDAPSTSQPSRPRPQRTLEKAADEEDLEGIKGQLAERAQEARKGWGKSPVVNEGAFRRG